MVVVVAVPPSGVVAVVPSVPAAVVLPDTDPAPLPLPVLGPPVLTPPGACAGPSPTPVRDAPCGPSQLKPMATSSANTAAPMKKYMRPLFSRALTGCGALAALEEGECAAGEAAGGRWLGFMETPWWVAPRGGKKQPTVAAPMER